MPQKPLNPAAFAEGVDHLLNLRRLITVRWWVMACMLVLCLLAPYLLNIPLPLLPLLSILLLTAIFNAIIQHQLKAAQSASADDLLRQLLIDISSLSALVFFSGGATNPLLSLLLPPVAIAALSLPARHVILVGGVAIAAYSALLLFYLPLPLADAQRATHLHLTGMWLTFAASTVMIAWFILRMTGLIRQRDAELAAAREQSLRDEQILAIGTLAAGAAHELGTPLATMLLLTSELGKTPDLPAEMLEDITLLHEQINHCKEIITSLSQRAGAERLENTPIQSVDRWLDGLRQRWHAIRPQTQTQLIRLGQGQPPALLADPRLEQSVVNLLNNAVNASQRPEIPIEIQLDWDTEHIFLELRDHGPGFSNAVLRDGGQIRFPSHAGGQGVGLLLTRSAIEQLGGQLTLFNAPDGGAVARLLIPQFTR